MFTCTQTPIEGVGLTLDGFWQHTLVPTASSLSTSANLPRLAAISSRFSFLVNCLHNLKFRKSVFDIMPISSVSVTVPAAYASLMNLKKIYFRTQDFMSTTKSEIDSVPQTDKG